MAALLLVVAASWPAAAKAGTAAGAAGSGSPLLAAVGASLEVDQVLDVGADVAVAAVGVELALEAPRSWPYLENLGNLVENEIPFHFDYILSQTPGKSPSLSQTRVWDFSLDAALCAWPERSQVLADAGVTAELARSSRHGVCFALSNPVNFSDPLGLEAGWIMQREKQWSDPNAGRKQEIRARLAEIDSEIAQIRFNQGIRGFLGEVDPMYQREALFGLMQQAGANVGDSTRVVRQFLGPAGTGGHTAYEQFHSYLGGQLSGKGEIFDISLEIMLAAQGLLEVAHGAGGLFDEAFDAAGCRAGMRADVQAAIRQRVVQNVIRSRVERSIALSVQARRASGFGQQIWTPWGQATQEASAAALAARAQVMSGARLYRVGTIGKSAGAEAQFWALESPVSPGFAGRYGIPPGNVTNADFIEIGVLEPGMPFVTRRAPPVGINPGGGIEVVVPGHGVRLRTFSGQ